MDALVDYVGIAFNQNIIIYSWVNGFALMYTLTHTEPILNIVLISDREIMIITQTGIYQYEIQTNRLISNLPGTYGFTSCMNFIITGLYFVVYELYPQTYSVLSMYSVDSVTNIVGNTTNSTNSTNNPTNNTNNVTNSTTIPINNTPVLPILP